MVLNVKIARRTRDVEISSLEIWQPPVPMCVLVNVKIVNLKIIHALVQINLIGLLQRFVITLFVILVVIFALVGEWLIIHPTI